MSANESERTIHRDMDALSTAGIPVVAERGSGGGWSLLEEYSTNLTGLTEAEIQALFLTKPTRLLADLGLRQASEAACGYLLSFGTQVAIVEPRALREKVIQLEESVVAFYQSNLSTRNARL